VHHRAELLQLRLVDRLRVDVLRNARLALLQLGKAGAQMLDRAGSSAAGRSAGFREAICSRIFASASSCSLRSFSSASSGLALLPLGMKRLLGDGAALLEGTFRPDRERVPAAQLFGLRLLFNSRAVGYAGLFGLEFVFGENAVCHVLLLRAQALLCFLNMS
jgi:hypothetical protein